MSTLRISGLFGGHLPVGLGKESRDYARHLLVNFVALTGLLAMGLAAGPAQAADTTVIGCLHYGSIDETPEASWLDLPSIFNRGLAEDQPIAHVFVELRKSWGFVADSDITDKDGCFSMVTSATPNTLRVQAANDYADVKEYKLIPLTIDKPIHYDHTIYESAYDDAVVDLGTLKIADNANNQFTVWHYSVSGTSITSTDIYKSRAFWTAGEIHRAASQVIELNDSVTDLDEVLVRMGTPKGAWFDNLVLPPRIHLPGEQAAVITHEYGHFIESRTGAFGIIPKYSSHTNCGEQKGTCWAFLEGLASWYSAINSHGFAPALDGAVNFTGPPVDNNDDGSLWDSDDARTALGAEWWVEGTYSTCTPAERTGWSDPRLVESVTAQVLWDLIDPYEDPIIPGQVIPNVVTNNIREIAMVDVSEVLDVLSATRPAVTPCSLITQWYTHSVTLEQFCEEYVDQHEGPTYPELYSAFAFNGVDIDCARDVTSPDAVSIVSASHPESEWRNTTAVSLTITDGWDDFSGIYGYYELWDNNPFTILAEGDALPGGEDFRNTDTVILTTRVRPHGDDQYLHIQTRDLAGHLGTTAKYGPIRIDIVPPYFEAPPLGPGNGEVLILGKYAHFEWEAADDLSGVNYVKVYYEDSSNGISSLSEAVGLESGSYDFYINPDIFEPTTGGVFSIGVWDLAGNVFWEELGTVEIVSPFAGPNDDLGFDLVNGRAVSGDIDGDGIDEIVLSGVDAGSATLRTVRLTPTATVMQNLSPGLEGGDLFLADTDRDGDLDLVAAGDFAGTAGQEIRLFQNDGTGMLTDAGPLPIPAMPGMVVRVVDLYGTGEPVLAYGGNRGVSAPNPELFAWNFTTGVLALVDGTEFLGGDFEVGDINGDEYHDFVFLGGDASGAGSLRWSLGDKLENEPTWPTVIGAGDLEPGGGDLDLGDWDADGDLDLFAMYQRTAGASTRNVTDLREWWASRFLLETAAAGANRINEGDGHIVAIYNDGWPDVLALGRRVNGEHSSWFATNSDLGHRGSGIPAPPRDQLLHDTDTAWGDFDGDQDLDYLVTGIDPSFGPRTWWYENLSAQQGFPNDDPLPPVSLASSYDSARAGYVFKWTAPGVYSDETAEPAFRYELRIGTAPGAGDIMTWAHPAGPSQQVAGVTYGTEVKRFVPLPLGDYYWSVRTVDGGWRRSIAATVQVTAATFVDCGTIPGDCDLDGVADACEDDTDGDGVIDDCDLDSDNDGVPDSTDIDPLDPLACKDADGDSCDDCASGVDGFGLASDVDATNDGPDVDGDGLCDPGDPCRLDNPNDSDADGVCDSVDICPGGDDGVHSDGDGVPDACDPCPLDTVDDSDGDGVCNSLDLCPGADDLADLDGDGSPNACDPCPEDVAGDSDGDGSCDADDLCPGADDGLDGDGDGVPNACDPCPLDAVNDSDFDTICDAVDICPGSDDFEDSDLDGVPDGCDNCPAAINVDQADTDGNGLGDACDTCAGMSAPFPMPTPLIPTNMDTFDWGPFPSEAYVARGLLGGGAGVGALAIDLALVYSNGSFDAIGEPSMGEIFWYLSRPNCPAGSYTSGGAAEVPGLRDSVLP